MPKDFRVVVRLSAEDDAWLAAESERLGCDKATWVRMMIKREMRPQAMVAGGELPPSDQILPMTYAGSVATAIPIQAPELMMIEEHGDAVFSEVALDEGFEDAVDGADQATRVVSIDPAAILALRLAEAELTTANETPAIPMRRVGRDKYNPGYR